MNTFKIGDSVRKKSGSSWEGRIVGTYSTELTPEGYAVESFAHKGSVQIYPVNALEVLTEHPSVREPLSDKELRDLVKESGLDWHRGYMPLFAGDETNRLALLVRAIERAHGIGVKGEA